VPAHLPEALERITTRSAAPELVATTFLRLLDTQDDALDRLVAGGDPTELASRVATVAGASTMLAHLLVAERRALEVLGHLADPVPDLPADGAHATDAVVTRYRLCLLRTAARDLEGLDDLSAVGASLAGAAAEVLERSVAAGDLAPDRGLAVIGMGKLGGAELNYASDVDVVLVGAAGTTEDDARRSLGVARACFRVDLDLRPEGRSGPTVRTLDGYRRYWARWAQPWERQALLKARPVAGDDHLGHAFADAAATVVWDHPFTADELAQIRAMKARTEQLLVRRGLGQRDLKRGHGGIRDVEFAVQLLQLVHGRLDPTIRAPTTLTALAQLASAGYVAEDDATALADGYRFLRTVEHRLQLVDGAQVHVMPTDRAAHDRLARVLGFADRPGRSASDQLTDALRRHQATVRSVHERLYFRPLLHAFAAIGRPDAGRDTTSADLVVAGAPGMSAEAVATRLAAFGFAGVERTAAAVSSLARGLTRRSRLMAQMLPLILDWLSQSPDPDLGLQQLQDLVSVPHRQALAVTAFRESPETARRLCAVLGSSRLLGEVLVRQPELIATVGDDRALRPLDADGARTMVRTRLAGRVDVAEQREQLARFWRQQLLSVAVADLLGEADVPTVAEALTSAADAIVDAAMALAASPVPWCAVALGRLGGRELAYGSDLDLVLVCDDDEHGEAEGEAAAAGERLLALVHGDAPSRAVVRVDLALRPEGGHGRLVRSLTAYQTYVARWTQTWERQAMLRARVVAGDADVGARFMAMADDAVWGRPLTPDDEAAIRRMKARVERERIPPREDPRFHLKLGPGALADVEWTVQLLQLRHRIRHPSTMAALTLLADAGAIDQDDARTLADAYRFCEHTRNRWHLVGALPGGTSPGDALPTKPELATRMARSLATSPAGLRDDYLRVTRRCRRVVERLFYGLGA
jgi:glutamate-ammonia-ligase adenylyltransferase